MRREVIAGGGDVVKKGLGLWKGGGHRIVASAATGFLFVLVPAAAPCVEAQVRALRDGIGAAAFPFPPVTLWVIGGFCLACCVMAVVALQRRRAEAQVAQSELRFRRVTRHMEEVFCVGSTETWEIDEISPAVERITGLSPAKVRRTPRLIMEAMFEADRQPFLAYLVRVQAGQEPADAIEFRMRDVQGRLRWVRFRGFDIGQGKIAGMATDITDSKQEDIAMSALVETLAGHVEQDFFDRAVRQLCAFLGCEMAFIGELGKDDTIQTLAMVQDGALKPPVRYRISGSPCLESMSREACIYPEGVQDAFPANAMLRQLGAQGYLGMPLRDRHGEIIGVMAALSRRRLCVPKRTREVAAILAQGIANEMGRLKSEQEKKAMEINLIRSQKMEAIGTLAGGISHDFNNILFPLMGYVQLMQDETPKESRHGRYLRQIHASALRAKKLVDQILAFSRKGGEGFEPVNVPEVLTEVMELVRASLPATIELKIEIADDILPVMGDATQIHQVVMNLVTNASHAMEGRGGCIWVSLASRDRPDGEGAAAPGLVLTVRDTGRGIDPAVMGSIFDPYFTTKPKEKGTGLGLAVVHGIVDNHGGKIDVTSTLGVGTTFTVYLPCLETACLRRDPPVAVPPVPTGHEHILVVDDEEEVCLVEQMMLERLGYRVSVAKSGRDALALLAGDPASVQLMLTDMTMPQMTGLQLVEKVRELGYPLAVLLCTGLNDAAQERIFQELGVRGLVKKPVSMDELADQVRGALDAPTA